VGQRLGQHFLRGRSYLERIAAALAAWEAPTAIEIGAGAGALTALLLERVPRLIAIELDPRLAAELRRRFASQRNFTLIEADVLATDLAQWGPVVVAGNLPYYITSPVIEKVLRLGPLLLGAVFLVQREVAERLAAAPGTRDYGWLTVATQLAADARILFGVPRSAFAPPPKVDSAVVRLAPHTRCGIEDREGFLEFARLCFRHKRKTLRNNLAPVYGQAVEELPEASRRAEQLSVEELITVYAHLRR